MALLKVIKKPINLAIVMVVFGLTIIFGIYFSYSPFSKYNKDIPTAKADASWYNTSWVYRKQITIDYTKVSSTLSNFPVLINLTSDAGLAANAQNDGDDIVFTLSDGTTKLDHEIETYTSSTGALVAWVEVPTLSNTTNTILYVYYGNSGASNQQTATSVWDANYLGVYHLDEPSGDLGDSTSNNHNGTRADNPSATISAKIGSGQQLSSSAITTTINILTDLGGSFTAEAWMNHSSPGDGWGWIFGETNDWIFVLGKQAGGNCFHLNISGIGGAGCLGDGLNAFDGNWHHVAWVFGSSNVSFYVDGNLITSFVVGGSGADLNSALQFGRRSNGQYFNGQLDEIRLSNSTRSAEWIATQYNNQNSPSTFYSLGSEVVNVPTPPTILYAHSTNAQSGNSNPTNLISLTPVFSALCNSENGDCTHYAIEVDDDPAFGSPVWQLGQTDIADIANGARSGNITYAGSQLNYNTTYYWRIRYYNINGAGTWSSGTNFFYVPRSMEMLNFSHGGIVQQGQTINIEWMSYQGENDETVKIEYSTNNFSSVTTIAASVNSTSTTSTVKTYSWTVPAITSSNVKLRISSNNDGNNYNVTSTYPFTIQVGTAEGILYGQDFSDDDFYAADTNYVSFASGQASYSVAGGWYTNWTKRKVITVTENSGATLTNYQVLVTTTYDADMQADFDDIRFTDSDGTTPIDYWLEDKTDSTTATFWVEIPEITTSSEKTIYMYYANSGVSSSSSISNAFVFGDDFESYAIDSLIDGQGGWRTQRVGGGGYAKISQYNGTNHLLLKSTDAATAVDRPLTLTNSGNALRMKIVSPVWDEAISMLISSNGSYAGDGSVPANGYAAAFNGWGATRGSLRVVVGGSFPEDQFSSTFTNGSYYQPEIAWEGSSIKLFEDGVVKKTKVDTNFSSLNYVGFNAWSSNDRYVDWFIVRKYTSSGPTFSIGSEVDYGSVGGSVTVISNTSHAFTTIASFSATTTVSGTGAVKFQVSDDGGSTWKYCVGDTLTTSTLGYTHSSTEAELTNACLAELTSGGIFNIRTYLYAGAVDTASIDSLSYLLISNTTPTLTTISPLQSSSSTITVTTTITDADSDITNLTILHSTNGTTWASTTISGVTASAGTVSIGPSTISGIDTNLTGSVNLTISWNIGTDLPNTNDTTVYLKLTPNDGTANGTAVSSTAFAVDTAKPTQMSNLVVASLTNSSVRLTLPTTTSADSNFSQYKIFFSTTSPVTESNSAFTSSTDVNLASASFNGASITTISSLSANTRYYFKIYAYDTWGYSTSSVSTINTYTLASDISSLSTTVNSQTQITVSYAGNSTQYYVENSTASTNSGWTTNTSYSFTGLTCGTSYSFRVKGKNGSDTETNWSSLITVSTSGCNGAASVAPATPSVIINPNSITGLPIAVSIDSSGISNLLFNVTNVFQMAISDNPNFTNISWQPYQSSFTYNTNKDTVLYIKFRSPDGGETKVYTVDVKGNSKNFTTNTLANTQSTKTKKQYTFTKFLAIGARGEEVKQLQIKLKQLGYFKYPTITGFFGNATRDAVIKFQKVKKLAPYPGYVGPGTRRELNR